MVDAPDTPPTDSARELQIEFDRAVDGKIADPLDVLVSLIAGGSSKPKLTDALCMQGDALDEYSLVRLVGIGGMGATYEAVDVSGDRVAVKVVGALSPSQLDRFRSECELLKRLDHPGIVRYLDHGVLSSGHGYLVMEFIEGQNLQDVLDDLATEVPAGRIAKLLREGSGEPARDQSRSYQRRMIRLLAKTAESLASAHEAGLIHRDVKPANILVNESIEPVLIDFGLGRDMFRSVSLTQSGAVMGTLSYMAPEQLADDTSGVDQRSDVFSMGLTLYRALVGKDLREAPHAVIHYGKRALRLDGAKDLDQDVQAVLYKCLDPNPKRRYDHAGLLAKDLHALLGQGKVQASMPSRLGLMLRRRNAKASLAALIAVIMTLVLLFLESGSPQLLHVSILNDGGDLYVDDMGPFKTPHAPFEVSPGVHNLEYRSRFAPTIRRSFALDARNRDHTENLLTISHNSPVTISHRLFDGAEAALLLADTGDPSIRLLVDGQLIDGPRRWLLVSPGIHKLEAIDESRSLHETQLVTLRANELNPTHMLPAQMLDIPGSFRVTLGSVLSPAPLTKGFRITYQNGSASIMNEFRERRPPDVEPGYLRLHTMISSVEIDQDAIATVRIEFEEPMRSLVFYADYQNDVGYADLDVDYSTAPGEWHKPTPWKGVTRTQAHVPKEGSRQFLLRAKIRVRQRPTTWSTARFLSAYIDDPGRPKPAFALVADPRPNVARIR